MMFADALPLRRVLQAPSSSAQYDLSEVRVVVAAICDILAANEDAVSSGLEVGSGNSVGMS